MEKSFYKWGMSMYVQRVRDAISEIHIDSKAFNRFIKILIRILKRKYHKSVVEKDVKDTVKNFISGTPPRIDYFEAYLMTLDELASNGATGVLLGAGIKSPTTWKELLFQITENIIFPIEIRNHLMDEQILLEVVALFKNAVTFTSHTEKGKFETRLHDFNRFLSIKLDDMKITKN